MAIAKKKGLGKGLGALLGDSSRAFNGAVPKVAIPEPAQAVEEEPLPNGAKLIYVDPSELNPNPKQPRRVFNEEALEELANSIRNDGVMEPVIIRDHNGKYELISGERRVRAAIMADLARIPAICREASDRDMLKLGLIENIQREDLNAIELARAYQELRGEFKWTQEQLADEVGKKRATVTNTLRLLNLPEVVQEMVADGSLSMGHARAILAIEGPAKQCSAARKVIALGLSVRQTEHLSTAKKAKNGASKSAAKDPHIVQLEDDLRRSLGTKVLLKNQSNGKGKIEIEYFNLDELDRLLVILRGR